MRKRERWYVVDRHFCSVVQYRVKATSKKAAKKDYGRKGRELNTDICRGRCVQPEFVTLDRDQSDGGED